MLNFIFLTSGIFGQIQYFTGKFIFYLVITCMFISPQFNIKSDCSSCALEFSSVSGEPECKFDDGLGDGGRAIFSAHRVIISSGDLQRAWWPWSCHPPVNDGAGKTPFLAPLFRSLCLRHFCLALAIQLHFLHQCYEESAFPGSKFSRFSSFLLCLLSHSVIYNKCRFFNKISHSNHLIIWNPTIKFKFHFYFLNLAIWFLKSHTFY